MKNFLIIVLALGLAAVAFMTRPDREDFDRYVQARQKATTEHKAVAFLTKAGKVATTKTKAPDLEAEGVEFKDFYLWTVVRKDGKTLFTGVFDHWVDNDMVRQVVPS